jgi:hypothetical protein
MPVSGISRVDEWTGNSGRWVAAARASRRSQPAPAPAIVEVSIGEERDVDETTTWQSQQAMTRAAAEEAYASN